MISRTSLKSKLLYERQHQDKEKTSHTVGKVFGKDTSDKRLLSKTYKELSKLNNKKAKNLIKKWAKDRNRKLTKDDIQKANKHMKRHYIIHHQGNANLNKIPQYTC